MQPNPAEPPLEDLADVRQRIAERLAGVGRLIAVMSGKGGVGKSAVAVNLALALAQRGERVGLLDADLHGPSVAKMLGLRGQPIRAGVDGLLRPIPGPLGVSVQSMDFFLQGNAPLAWEGAEGEGAPLRSALEQAALGDLLGYTEWGALDLLIVDLAPGADRLPALAWGLPPVLGALAVAIPTEVAMLDVERSLRRAWETRVPILGVVENLGSAICARCGEEGPLFREASVERLARDLSVEVLARIPFDPALAAAADEGRPFLEGGGRQSRAGREFGVLAERVGAWRHPGPEGETW